MALYEALYESFGSKVDQNNRLRIQATIKKVKMIQH